MTNSTGKATIVLIALSFAISGCAALRDRLFPRLPPRAPATVDQAVMKDYIIGPGDSLNIIVWRNPEVSGSFPVRPDGKITAPLVEDLPALGKTSTELARDLEKALSKYIQEPVVSVIVTGFIGPYTEQIRVIGQAAKPQALPYRRNMTVLDVMIAVGGITDFAAGNRAVLVRGSTKEQYNVRLHDLLKRGDISANVEVTPGDVLVIPESIF